MGSSTENSGYGPTLNPWDRTRFPAAPPAEAPPPSRPDSRRGRSAPTRGARSASPRPLCGIVGLKPTYGACSRYG